MLTTETEALSKTCHQLTGLCLQNENCTASECMTWRWFDAVSDDGTRCHYLIGRNNDHLPLDLSERRGYCGLAGTP